MKKAAHKVISLTLLREVSMTEVGAFEAKKYAECAARSR
jgi:hypothetical protein